jgi:hypothetical protein
MLRIPWRRLGTLAEGGCPGGRWTLRRREDGGDARM